MHHSAAQYSLPFPSQVEAAGHSNPCPSCLACPMSMDGLRLCPTSMQMSVRNTCSQPEMGSSTAVSVSAPEQEVCAPRACDVGAQNLQATHFEG